MYGVVWRSERLLLGFSVLAGRGSLLLSSQVRCARAVIASGYPPQPGHPQTAIWPRIARCRVGWLYAHGGGVCFLARGSVNAAIILAFTFVLVVGILSNKKTREGVPFSSLNDRWRFFFCNNSNYCILCDILYYFYSIHSVLSYCVVVFRFLLLD